MWCGGMAMMKPCAQSGSYRYTHTCTKYTYAGRRRENLTVQEIVYLLISQVAEFAVHPKEIHGRQRPPEEDFQGARSSRVKGALSV